MDVIALLPRLHLLRFPVGQAYLWRNADALTLVDAGPPGSGRAIADAVTALGHDPAAVRRVVLTHFHEDHAGGAAELADLTGAQVLAHAADAAVLRREVRAPEPVLEQWERPLHAAALRHLPVREVEPPARISELADGDVLAFGGGARVVHVPDHRVTPSWIPPASAGGGNEAPAEQGRKSRFAARADRRPPPTPGSTHQIDAVVCEL
ncbi:MBL fold metallo-hydrolase [Streptomyces bobili]|uniref:MBL fold metallo-hydrolase n=1 Tax=Streptomyces bobili TaxID=67280 RepID=UPI0037888E2B